MARSRVRYVPQMEAVECGAACLTMILAWYGHHAPLSELREACGVDRDGASALRILEAAEVYGLLAEAESLELADLAAIDEPAIIHWEMNHFVVLDRWTALGAVIVDPALGPRYVPAAEFDRCFTGVCIRFKRSDQFKKRRREPIALRRCLEPLRDALGPLCMILSMTVALNVAALALPLITRLFVDSVLLQGHTSWLYIIGLSGLAVVTTSALLSFSRAWLLTSIERFVDQSMARRFVRHLLELPLAFFLQRSSADLVNRVQSNKTIRELLAGQTVAVLVDGLLLITYLALMVHADLRLSSVVIVAGLVHVLLFVAARPHLQRNAMEWLIKQIRSGSELYQILRGILTVKCSGNEAESRMRWLNLQIDTINANLRQLRATELVGILLSMVHAVVPMIVLLLGADRILRGQLTVGELVAFQMLQAGFLGSLGQIIRALVGTQMLPVVLARMDDVLEAPAEAVAERKSPLLTGALEFRNISFRYAPYSPLVLRDLSFRVPCGAKVALVGASGSGKSTVARLLLGLYRPESGAILLDGQDMIQFDPSSVRRQIGVVLQDVALFHGTIRENLSLFQPNASADHVAAAARAAQIHDDIQSLPLGYDTVISASAGSLSGGQRQRLALARAILHHPAIIVLDEATSALDAATEAAVEHYLRTRQCTRIVIAHRLSTVRDADAIIVLDQGEIVETGSHEELLALNGYYARLVAQGAGPEEKERVGSAPVVESVPPAADLRKFPVLQDLTDEEVGLLAPQLRSLVFDAGSLVLVQNDKPTGLYFILEGAVDIRIADPGLPSLTVATIGVGDVLGEIGMIDGSPNSATAVAAERSRLVCLPVQQFQELRRKRDMLAMRLLLGLGRLVSERIRSTNAQCRDSAPPTTRLGIPEHVPGQRFSRALELRETPLGAGLTSQELAVLQSMGRVRHLAADEVVFEEGQPGDDFSVVLRGRIGVRAAGTQANLNVLRPGSLFGEVSFFNLGVRTATCTAAQPATIISIPMRDVHEMLEAGQTVAWKLLSHLVQSLVWHLRLANIQLREAVARSHNEAQKLLEERERTEAEEHLTGGIAPYDPQQPVLASVGSGLAPAACLTWILRRLGRPVAFQSVADDWAGDVTDPTAPLAEAARQVGFLARRMHLQFGELACLDTPLLMRWGVDHFVVAARRSGRHLVLMDPAHGFREVDSSQVAGEFSGDCYEIVPDLSAGHARSLGRRLAGFGRKRAGVILMLAAPATLLQLAAFAVPVVTAAVVETVLPTGDLPLLGILAATLATLAVCHVMLLITRMSAVHFLRAHFDRDMLDQLVGHVLKLPLSYFESHCPADVLVKVESFDALRDLLVDGAIAAFDVVTIVGCVPVILFIDPTLALVIAAVVLSHAVVLAGSARALRRLDEEAIVRSAEQQDRLLEVLNGITTMRIAGDAERALHRWLPSFHAELTTHVRLERLCAVLNPALGLARNGALIIILWLGCRGVLDQSLNLGQLLGVVGFAVAIHASLESFAGQFTSFTRGSMHYSKLRELFQERPERESDVLIPPGKLRGRVALEHVSFRYGPDAPVVLDDVSLAIEAGEKIAIVGRSGSGKSTLGKLLVGAYLPTSGRIQFDGKDASHLDLTALRKQIGVVLQDTFLFGASIRENLMLAAPQANLQMIEEATRKAAIQADIEDLPMGYDTVLAECGSTFSGGQRQRLAIARAVVNNPVILLLDEATSALDNVTQSQVDCGLDEAGCTRIVIAHRLSTVRNADAIVVMDRGRIVETGTHDQLIQQQGLYWQLVRSQMHTATPRRDPTSTRLLEQRSS